MFKFIILGFVKLWTSLKVALPVPLKKRFYFVSCSNEDANGSNFRNAVILMNCDTGQPKIIALNNKTSVVQITYILKKGNLPIRTLIG
jgi:hypothetical protein